MWNLVSLRCCCCSLYRDRIAVVINNNTQWHQWQVNRTRLCCPLTVPAFAEKSCRLGTCATCRKQLLQLSLLLFITSITVCWRLRVWTYYFKLAIQAALTRLTKILYLNSGACLLVDQWLVLQIINISAHLTEGQVPEEALGLMDKGNSWWSKVSVGTCNNHWRLVRHNDSTWSFIYSAMAAAPA